MPAGGTLKAVGVLSALAGSAVDGDGGIGGGGTKDGGGGTKEGGGGTEEGGGGTRERRCGAIGGAGTKEGGGTFSGEVEGRSPTGATAIPSTLNRMSCSSRTRSRC